MEPALEQEIRRHLDAGALVPAATAAVRGYGPEVLGYLRAVLGPSDADEAFAVYCEFLWVELPQFRGASTFRTWSYRLAWGAARRVLEDAFRRRAQRLPTDELEAIAQEVRSSTAVHLKAETAARLARVRAQLTAEEQTLLVLRIDRDLPWTDVAAVMAEPEPALRKRMERLKEKIRRLLDP